MIAIWRVRIPRRQIRKALRRSQGRLVDTVADARAVARANDERVQVSIAAKRHLKVGQACDCKRLR